MKSTIILNTAHAFDSNKDTNNFGNPLITEGNIVEESSNVVTTPKTVYQLFMKLVNSVVRIVEGIFEPYYKLLAMNTGIAAALIIILYKALKQTHSGKREV